MAFLFRRNFCTTCKMAHPCSLSPPMSDQMGLVALASPNSSLSHTHTSPAGDLAHPGALTPPTGDQLDLVALVGPSSNPSPAHTITDSQVENSFTIIAPLTHQWVTQIPKPWTLSLPPTGIRRYCPRLREVIHLPWIYLAHIDYSIIIFLLSMTALGTLVSGRGHN